MKFSIRLLYLYLFSFVGLLIVVIGSVNLVNLGLKTFVFKEADRYDYYPQPAVQIEGEKPVPQITYEEERIRQNKEITRQRQREFSNSLAMILVGAPLYLYHWKTIQKESIKNEG